MEAFAGQHISTLAAAAALQRDGQVGQAQRLYEQVLRSEPKNHHALHLLGLLHIDNGQMDKGLLLMRRAIAHCPDYLEAINNISIELAKKGRHAEALAYFDKALQIDSRRPEVHYNRSAALHALRRYPEAIESCDRALALYPDYPEALSNRAAALVALARFDEAVADYDRVLALRPDDPRAWTHRGIALFELRRLTESLASHERAIEIKPDYAEAWSHRGNTLHAMQGLEADIVAYDRARSAKGSVGGTTLPAGQRPLDAAITSYRRAIALQPDFAEAHYNEAQSLLLDGDFATGWHKYEWRWKATRDLVPARTFRAPLWLGKTPLKGRTILLHAEQGLGDTIQFCRYVEPVEALGARVILEVQPELKSLMSGLGSSAHVVARGEQLPPYQFHCPLMSLPLAFGTELHSIPARAGYLSVTAERQARWEAVLGERVRPRVGLAWAGNPRNSNNRNRSMPLRTMLACMPDCVDLISLQPTLSAEETATTARFCKVRQFTRQTDLADTAALVSLMDLVVSVDTAMAHLSAALGRPTQVLLCWAADWRWLLDRSDSPWYPTARLVRQPVPGDWDTVMRQVRETLVAGASHA